MSCPNLALQSHLPFFPTLFCCSWNILSLHKPIILLVLLFVNVFPSPRNLSLNESCTFLVIPSKWSIWIELHWTHCIALNYLFWPKFLHLTSVNTKQTEMLPYVFPFLPGWLAHHRQSTNGCGVKSGSKTASGSMYQLLTNCSIEKFIVLTGKHMSEKICFGNFAPKSLKENIMEKTGKIELTPSNMVFKNLSPFFLCTYYQKPGIAKVYW